jgi:NAD(P)-dependent dehydrogenase (short-subunit alcohol dehydrogenase family)
MQRFLDGCELALLINNAGMVGPVGSAASVSAAESARAIALNVAAPLLLTAAFTQATAQAGERRVMHISSGAGRNAYPGWGVYCASKAALDHHARAAALDQVPRLRICSIAPGVIDTDMQAQIRAAALEDFPARQRFEAMKRNGELADADSSAEALVGYLLDQRFGASPVEDIRTWA